MLKAIVEKDGRIRVPNEAIEAAHLEAGQAFDLVISGSTLTLFRPDHDEWSDTAYGPTFLDGLDRALKSAADGLGAFDDSDEAFLASVAADTPAE